MPIVNSEIGMDCNIWHVDLVNIYDSILGENTKIGAFVEIGRCNIGSNCNISSHCFLCAGVMLEDDVFIGPGTTFTNIKTPRAFVNRKNMFLSTLIKKGASIGAGSTIVCGVTIGEYALVGAGSVITKSVPSYGLVYGNPARIHGRVNKDGKIFNPTQDVFKRRSCENKEI